MIPDENVNLYTEVKRTWNAKYMVKYLNDVFTCLNVVKITYNYYYCKSIIITINCSVDG